ncbi:U4/U6.U5 tri-snRNP-associated protein snu66 [Paramyrothecium foliicola]|nr:U4/U6.U5 tri-snRNP-associated protein snu66 [Paramyrothecium foliicola]
MDPETIAETNRIRVSLGMKPLPVPGADSSRSDDGSGSENDADAPSTLESRQAQSYDNYKKAQEAEAAKKRREEKAAAIRKARDNAQRFAVLEGKGLGEADDGGDVDTKAWLLGQKKRQKKIEKARKLEEELVAAEAAAAAAVQYTSRDLAGIKVAHDTSAFLDGNEQILTLKDATIDENEEEGDELENLGLREQENRNEQFDLKKKRPGYNPLDDDEGEGGILAQYDDEISGKKRKKFTLDSSGLIAELSDILGAQPSEANAKGQAVSLDDIIDGGAAPSSDYMDATKIKVKKPKKKGKQTRQKQFDEDDLPPPKAHVPDPSAMEIDEKEGVTTKKRRTADDELIDDEDLQASLAIQRRNALKKRKRTRPEDIAEQLKQQEDEPEDVHTETNNGGLVIGEILEFVAGLSWLDEDSERKLKRAQAYSKTPDPQEDHDMADEDEDSEEKPVKEESPTPGNEAEEIGVDEEKAVGSGMGATLALLRERGLVKANDSDQLFASFRDQEEFLAKKRQLEEELDEQTRIQRERDRASGRLDRMSVREREEWARQQNNWREQQQSRRIAELYKSGYKPNVELKYTDEHGRQVDQKEAFKLLSHQFHGKGSGKGKTEKRLKKIEDEKRREGRSMFDASQGAGMSAAAQQQLKKRKEAGVRLG